MNGDDVNIFIAGASGAIGGHLVTQLVARGHEVVGTTRSAAKAEPEGTDHLVAASPMTIRRPCANGCPTLPGRSTRDRRGEYRSGSPAGWEGRARWT